MSYTVDMEDPVGKTSDFLKTLYGRPATVKTKKSLFNNHVRPHVTGGGVPAEMVHRACRAWRDEELSVGTVKGCMVLLAEYMKFGYQWEIDKKRLTHQYFGGMAKPPEKLKVWNGVQVKQALEQAQQSDSEMHTILEVALGTGMRRGEIFGLMWDDVDFIDGYISISRSRDIASGEIGPTKNGKARRIQMSARVAGILEKSYNVGDTGYVFKTYFDPNSRLATIATKAGLPVVTFHALRHTFATTCFEKGMRPKWVSTMLGHSKLTTTLDLYWQNFQTKEDMESLYE